MASLPNGNTADSSAAYTVHPDFREIIMAQHPGFIIELQSRTSARTIRLRRKSGIGGHILVLILQTMLPFVAAGIAAHAQSSADSLFSFHPLDSGNIWQYREIEVYAGNGHHDTTLAVREIIGDTIMEDGLRYAIVRTTSISVIKGRENEYLRQDSASGRVQRRLPGGSSRSQTFDSVGCDWYGDFHINCDTLTAAGMELPVRIIHTLEPDSPKYFGRGIGLVREEINDPDNLHFIERTLAYARVNGREYGSWVSAVGNANTMAAFQLSQNIPNPCSSATLIAFSLARQSHVLLDIMNQRGEYVRTLMNEWREAGEHAVEMRTDDLSDGIYFYRLRTGSRTITRSMIVLQ